MAYQRKTRDLWDVMGSYDGGRTWEAESCEESPASARRALQEYRDNGPGMYRLRRYRERI